MPTDGLFENYKVVVNALMADGTKYTYEYGDSQGEAHRYFVPANTVSLTEQTAKNIMARLKGTRNKGTIKTVLYPQVNMFDFVEYTDTMLPELTGNYYVIGRNLSFATNLIVIAHGTYMDLPDGTTKIFPQGVGQKLSPPFFSKNF